METYYEMLNYTLCNETSMKYLGNDFLIDLPLNNLYCIGRNGQHRYNNMDHSMLTGFRCVDCILDKKLSIKLNNKYVVQEKQQ